MNKRNKMIVWLSCLFVAGMMLAACGGDDPVDAGGNGGNGGGGGSSSTTLSVTDPSVTNITTTSAVVTATAKGPSVTERGVCYNTSGNPTINDKKVTATTENMSVTLTGLTAATTYHVRAYVQNSTGVKYSTGVTFTTLGGEEEQTLWPSALRTVSVHDPSIVYDPASKRYYIFGSHRASAWTSNLLAWTAVTIPWAAAGTTNAANNVAFVTPAVKKVKKGGKEEDLPNFSAMAWAKRGNAGYSIDGNLWAPDVIYNKSMNKWCMYMSVNGDFWYSSIVMLTSDNISGPYLYQAPVVISGFHTGTAYKSTDLELAIGAQTSLPSRYAVGNNWGRRYPNAIDPCVFYDEQGKLWMSYGSWSGGIYMLELNEDTGLRDYDVTYTQVGNGDGITVDPYFGKKIAGGYYSSGEASYIEYIGGYYYLFVTNGGLAAGGVPGDYNNGGYQMRVFRSKNPDGPYVDSKGQAALYPSYLLNFGPDENDGNRGVNIFGAYGQWGNKLTVGGVQEHSGERSQGHNSVIAAEDGRSYLVYHTRFQNWGEGHQVRVHQLYQNQDGWLVAAPFEYTGEVARSADIASKQLISKDKIAGNYKLLIHNYRLDHRKKEMATPVDITLNSDGTITGEKTGTWSIQEGTSYITINIGQPYNGVMVLQTLEPTNDQVPAFTALCSATGVTIWGYRYGN